MCPCRSQFGKPNLTSSANQRQQEPKFQCRHGQGNTSSLRDKQPLGVLDTASIVCKDGGEHVHIVALMFLVERCSACAVLLVG